jgi:hypothetical protein
MTMKTITVDGKLVTGRTVAAHIITEIQSEYGADKEDGTMDTLPASFSEMHDRCDANEYIISFSDSEGWMIPSGLPEADQQPFADVVNAAAEIVEAWLACRTIKATERGDILYASEDPILRRVNMANDLQQGGHIDGPTFGEALPEILKGEVVDFADAIFDMAGACQNDGSSNHTTEDCGKRFYG